MSSSHLLPTCLGTCESLNESRTCELGSFEGHAAFLLFPASVSRRSSQGTCLWISLRRNRVQYCQTSDSIEEKHNFYKILSSVMLNLASTTLEKIGSFTVYDSGEMSLSNRPLTLRLQLLESEGIPIAIPRHRCYSTVDSYVYDLLKLAWT